MRVAAAKAALADAIANAEMLESDVEIARHNIEAASAAVEEAKMRHIHLGGDAKRFRELIKSNAVSESAKEGARSPEKDVRRPARRPWGKAQEPRRGGGDAAAERRRMESAAIRQVGSGRF